eukprot:5633747-Pyramimonas_sp.AAC.1
MYLQLCCVNTEIYPALASGWSVVSLRASPAGASIIKPRSHDCRPFEMLCAECYISSVEWSAVVCAAG